MIGRSSTSGLALADPFLSRHHARLFRQDDQILIEDLGSRNGTLLNGVVIDGPTALAPGDVVNISGSTIRVLGGGPDPQASSEIQATVFRPATEILRSGSSLDRQVTDVDYRRYSDRLRRLNEIHEALGRSIDADELLDLILYRAFQELRPEQAVIFLRRPDGSVVRTASREQSGTGTEFPVSKSLVDEVCGRGMAAIVIDTATDERFANADSIILSGLRSLMAAPLLAPGEEALGMIVLSSRIARREYREEDLEFLVSLASIAALKLRNAALAVEAAERRRLEQELALARHIQESLIPERLPQVEGYEVLADNLPSRGVSGDLFQLRTRNQDLELVLLICDVSGKGMPAALLCSSIEALVTGPIETGDPPDVICRDLSRRLYERTPVEKFATAIVAVLRLETAEVEFCNAGHNPGLLVRADGRVEHLSSHGPPIGLVRRAGYESSHVRLEPGDSIVLYTDGITEAEDENGEEYGLERLSRSVSQAAGLSLVELRAALEQDLAAHVGAISASDDQTFVLLRRSTTA